MVEWSGVVEWSGGSGRVEWWSGEEWSSEEVRVRLG